MLPFMKRRIVDFLLDHGVALRRVTLFERLLIREVRYHAPVTFVQIGANDGVSYDNLYWYVTQYGFGGIVVEPLCDMFERLKYNYRAFPNVKPERVAIHPTLDHVTLYRVNSRRHADHPDWAGIASLNPRWHEALGVCPEDMCEEAVPATPLMPLLQRHGIERLNLLQIDVEGFDEDILRMIDFSRVRPRLIKFEARRGEPSADITSLLSRNHYEVARDGPDFVAWTRES